MKHHFLHFRKFSFFCCLSVPCRKFVFSRWCDHLVELIVVLLEPSHWLNRVDRFNLPVITHDALLCCLISGVASVAAQRSRPACSHQSRYITADLLTSESPSSQIDWC